MTIEELEQIAKSVIQENDKYDFEVNVCMDLACMSQGSDKLRDSLEKAPSLPARRCWYAAPGAWDHALPGLWFASTPIRLYTTM